MPIVGTVAELRAVAAGWHRAQGARVAVVPTMGGLPEGHPSLVRAALQKAEAVVVTLSSILSSSTVPPTFAAYPRTENEDAAELVTTGAHLLYVPD
ncbi:hypothetical protein CK218_28715 [Mesorhizobium sp. WSM3879]|nr:hypothetical protein CK214_26225 [Mesorhizobium sp. WSM3882]PBB31658.1 hypothetical protein CK221_26705 [Mesorhizobium sp. WSM3868]PBB77764.1 hypothetical protein CK218_28715 [Mesorhizobium sp. WSM3879]